MARTLKKYQSMRDFGVTAEPSGKMRAPRAERLRFVIQKHAATRLHYDLRLEFDGSNFRATSLTPASASANGMFPASGTPSSSSAACQTGQVEADSDYLYFCTAPNSWKRAAWSSF